MNVKTTRYFNTNPNVTVNTSDMDTETCRSRGMSIQDVKFGPFGEFQRPVGRTRTSTVNKPLPAVKKRNSPSWEDDRRFLSSMERRIFGLEGLRVCFCQPSSNFFLPPNLSLCFPPQLSDWPDVADVIGASVSHWFRGDLRHTQESTRKWREFGYNRLLAEDSFPGNVIVCFIPIIVSFLFLIDVERHFI